MTEKYSELDFQFSLTTDAQTAENLRIEIKQLIRKYGLDPDKVEIALDRTGPGD